METIAKAPLTDMGSKAAKLADSNNVEITLLRLLSIRRFIGFSWRNIIILLVLTLGQVFFEGFSLALVLPILEILIAGGQPENVQDPSLLWKVTEAVFHRVGLPVDFFVLSMVALLAILFRQAFKFILIWYSARTEQRMLRDLRTRAWQTVLHARIDVLESTSDGRIVSDIVTQAATGLRVPFIAVLMIGSILMGCVYVGLLFIISTDLALLTLLCAIVMMPLMGLIIKKSKSAGTDIALLNQELSEFLIGRLRSLRLIKLNATEARELDQLASTATELAARTVKVRLLAASIPVVMEPVSAVMAFGFMGIGLFVFGMQGEAVLAFLFMMLRTLPILKEVTKQAQVAAAQIFALSVALDRFSMLNSARESRTGVVPFPPHFETLSFNDVSFTYSHGGVPAIIGANLVIEEGQLTAIVGPSGAGKSTIVDLMPRLREPENGQITLGRLPLNKVDMNSLRGSISYVPQQTELLHGTIAEHIGSFSPDSCRDNIIRAARLANAHEFIVSLNNGYDTVLGYDGRQLSGGERKRLDLARALAKKPRILVLDEPAAGLDPLSTNMLSVALTALRREGNLTIILVEHELTLVDTADQIVVMQDAQVVDVGRHDDLMLNMNGWYYKAYTKQHEQRAMG